MPDTPTPTAAVLDATAGRILASHLRRMRFPAEAELAKALADQARWDRRYDLAEEVRRNPAGPEVVAFARVLAERRDAAVTALRTPGTDLPAWVTHPLSGQPIDPQAFAEAVVQLAPEHGSPEAEQALREAVLSVLLRVAQPMGSEPGA